MWQILQKCFRCNGTFRFLIEEHFSHMYVCMYVCLFFSVIQDTDHTMSRTPLITSSFSMILLLISFAGEITNLKSQGSMLIELLHLIKEKEEKLGAQLKSRMLMCLAQVDIRKQSLEIMTKFRNIV